MKDPFLMHFFTPATNVSPFDINMAYDAGWDACIPYTKLELAQIPDMTQDVIFSRSPKLARKSAIFIGGRDLHLALDMLAKLRSAMVPPFAVSAFVDPSGAFTTAAAMVACAEQHLPDRNWQGKRVLLLGGSGPVGTAAAILIAEQQAQVTLVGHHGIARAQATAADCKAAFQLELAVVDGADPETMAQQLEHSEVIFATAKAGVCVLPAERLAQARKLLVACDVNAVPPSGIEGLSVDAQAQALPIAGNNQAIGFGALAIGQVKYQTQQQMLRHLAEHPSACYLDFRDALSFARRYASP